MMWKEKIEKKYPEGWQEFRNWYFENFRAPFPELPCQKVNGFRFLWGWLEDFFDSKGIYINIFICVTRRKSILYDYTVGNSQHTFGESDFKSRQEAREAAIMKAFKILKEASNE